MELEPTKELSAVDEVLAQEGFIRSLARKLVRDDDLASDVFQETLIAAARRPRRDTAPLRSWLARVVRNRAVQSHRMRQRRERHEALAPSRAAEAGPSETAERDAVRTHVIAAVRSMNEPYRSAILLRFFEDLEPQAMAERLGIPVETARTRVKRGLALLRARLDREYGGDSQRWGLALIAWSAPAAPTTAGVVALAARYLIGALVVIGCVLFFWLEHRPTEPPARPNGDELALRDDAPARSTPTSTASQSDVRTTELAVAARDELLMRVVDGDEHRPVEGAAVHFTRTDGSRANATTGSDGVASCVWPRERALAVAVEATPNTLEHEFKLEPDARPQSGSSWELVVERASRVSGRAIDRFGEALVGIEVVARSRDRAAELARATTDGSGRFELAHLPHAFSIDASSAEHVARETFVAELPRAAHLEPLELAFEDPAPTAGRVLDRAGNGLADVELELTRIRGDADVRAAPFDGTWFESRDGFDATSSTDGAFEFATATHGRFRLVARRAGFAELSRTIVAGERALEVVLDPGVAQEFECFDGANQPLAGARLSVRRATHAEGASGTSNEPVCSDEKGRARVEGFLDGQALWLHAEAPNAATTLAGPFVARTGAPIERLVLDAGRELNGRVLDSEGRPAAGLFLTARAKVAREVLESFALDWHSDWLEIGATRTDAHGVFRFPLLARVDCDLEVRTNQHASAIHVESIEPGRDQLDVRLDAPQGGIVLRGSVRDGWSGAALKHFSVTASPDEVARRTPRVVTNVGDGSDRFELELGEPGSWILTVASDGYATATIPIANLERGVRTLEVRMFEKRELAVRVVDAHGTPVPFATIALADADERPITCAIRASEERSAIQVGARGDACLRELPATLVRLHVTTPLVRESSDFEFQLRAPLEGVQELVLRDLDVDLARRAIALELYGVADGQSPAITRDRDAQTDAANFDGHVRVCVRDLANRVVLSFAGVAERGRLRSDSNRLTVYLRRDGSESSVATWRQELRSNWGAAFGRDFFPLGDPLRGLPVPYGECTLELSTDDGALVSAPIPAAAAIGGGLHVFRAFLAAGVH